MLKSLSANLDRLFFGRTVVTTITTVSHHYHQVKPINLRGFRIEENNFSPKQTTL